MIKPLSNSDNPASIIDNHSASARIQDSLPISLELLKLMAPITMVLLVILTFHYRYFVNTEKTALMRAERQSTELLNQVVTGDIASVISDTQLLADYFEQLMSSKLSVTESSRQLLTQFLLTSKHKRLYDHIRLLDIKGNEITRVNFNDGTPVVVPKTNLQNKADRYYFSAISELNQGEIYISPMDLNIEGDTIEIPLKPTIRSGMSLFRINKDGDQTEKIGLLILNYAAQNLISRFKQVAGDRQDHVMLVNHQGYWLISPDPNDNWGFMFDQKHSFKKLYPEEWQQINQSNHGQSLTDEGLFSFSTVSPYLDSSNSNYWKIISQISPTQLNAPQQQFFKRYIPVYLILLLFTSLGSTLIARYRVIHHKAETQATYESRFRHTLEDIQLIAVTFDAKGIITFCNEWMLNLTDYTHDQIIGQNWFDLFINQEDNASEKNFIGGVIKANTAPTEPHECNIYNKLGKVFLVSWSVTPIQNADNLPLGITLIGEDITEKRNTERQLITLNRAVEQSPSTVMITNTKGEIEYVNEKFEELTGYTQAEVIGKNPNILKSGATHEDEYHDMWKIILDGDIWRGELKNRKKNGTYYWERAIMSPVRSTEGEIIHFISLKEDITEQKRLEEKLEERNQEVLRNTELAAVGKMANMIAHDLRNPLSAIKLTLQMIGKTQIKNSVEQIQELTGISLAQIVYMESIITDVMSYSRPDALQQEWLAIPQLIDRTLVLMQRVITDNKAKVSTYYQPGLPTLFGDSGKLQQVISNLISNAIQSTEEAVTPQLMISVSLLMTDHGSRVKIEIKDNGKGIDPCNKTRAFEPFYTNKAKGTGLGLAIVKRFIELHEGIIELEPMAGGGTCATIQLPIMPAKSDETTSDDVFKTETNTI